MYYMMSDNEDEVVDMNTPAAVEDVDIDDDDEDEDEDEDSDIDEESDSEPTLGEE